MLKLLNIALIASIISMALILLLGRFASRKHQDALISAFGSCLTFLILGSLFKGCLRESP